MGIAQPINLNPDSSKMEVGTIPTIPGPTSAFTEYTTTVLKKMDDRKKLP